MMLEQVALALRAWRGERLSRVIEAKFMAPLLPEEYATLQLIDAAAACGSNSTRRHAAGARPRRGNGMSEHWQSRPEGGGRFAIWLIRTIALYGGRRVARLCLYPITGYFYLRRGPERLASALSATRVGAGHAWQVLKHIHAFAATILDRMFLLAHGEKRFEISVEGLEELMNVSRRVAACCCSARTRAASRPCAPSARGDRRCRCGWSWTSRRHRR